MAVRKREWTTRSGEARVAWVADYVDQKGKRHIQTFEKRKDADAYHANVKVDVSKGIHSPVNKSITVSQAAEQWLEYVTGEGAERSTVEQYQRHVDLHIVPRIGGEKLATLTAPRIELVRDESVRDLSPPMARKVLQSIKAILKDANRLAAMSRRTSRQASR